MYSQIKIRLGVEADIYPGFELSLQELRVTFPIDYVIGSVHFMDGDPVFFYDVKPRTDSEIQDFIKAANDRDPMTQAGLINFPYLEIDVGEVDTCADADEFGARERPPRPDAHFEWREIRLERVKVIQKSNISANVGVDLHYLDADHHILLSTQAVYLLTLKQGHWGIHAVSVL